MSDDKKTGVPTGTNEKEGEKDEKKNPPLETPKPSGEGVLVDTKLFFQKPEKAEEKTMEFLPEPSCQEQLSKLRKEVAGKSQELGNVRSMLTKSEEQIRQLGEKLQQVEKDKTASLAKVEEEKRSFMAEKEREFAQLRQELEADLALASQQADDWHHQYCDLVSQGVGTSGDTGCQEELARYQQYIKERDGLLEKSLVAQIDLEQRLEKVDEELRQSRRVSKEKELALGKAQQALEEKKGQLIEIQQQLKEKEKENELDEATSKKRGLFSRKGGKS